MKLANKKFLVVDGENNTVAFLCSDSLSILENKYFVGGGYLNGAFGIETAIDRSYIYLWFSSGDLYLLNGYNLR